MGGKLVVVVKWLKSSGGGTMHVLAALLGLLAHCGKHKSDSGLMAALVIDETLNNVKLKNSHKISRIIDFFVTRSLNSTIAALATSGVCVRQTSV